MALSDYRLCDICDRKAFYDARLNYEFKVDDATRVAGEIVRGGYSLEYLGDWTVLCKDCAKTHKAVIVPIGEKNV